MNNLESYLSLCVLSSLSCAVVQLADYSGQFLDGTFQLVGLCHIEMDLLLHGRSQLTTLQGAPQQGPHVPEACCKIISICTSFQLELAVKEYDSVLR